MKWGTRYGADFVNRLNAAVQRNTARPTQLVCLTDDPSDIDEAVICKAIPHINLPDNLITTPWRKLVLWQDGLAGLKGDVLFLDLDLVITSSLDEMFDYEPGRFCVIENWTQPGKKLVTRRAFAGVSEPTPIYLTSWKQNKPAFYRPTGLSRSISLERLMIWCFGQSYGARVLNTPSYPNGH